MNLTAKTAYGVVEILEYFEHHVLVEDINGGIFLIEYQNILPDQDEVKYDDTQSNIISLRGYKWAKSIKKTKPKTL